MADFGSFLSNLAVGAGRQIQYSNQMQERELAMEDQKSQIATRLENSKILRDDYNLRSGKMQYEQQQEALKRKDLLESEQLKKGEAQLELSPIEAELKKAEAFQQQATFLRSRGHPREAEGAQKDAEFSLKIAKGLEKGVKDRQESKVEEIGSVAEDILQSLKQGEFPADKVNAYLNATKATPTPSAFIANPAGSDGNGIYSKQGQMELILAAQKSKEVQRRRESESKVQNRAEAIVEKERRNQERETVDAERKAEKANAQAGKAPSTITVDGSIYQFDPEKKSSGDRLATDSRYAALGKAGASKLTIADGKLESATTAVADAARKLSLQAILPPGTTTSMFTQLSPKDAIASIIKGGTTIVTDEMSQAMAANAKGLGKALGAAIQAKEGGRAFTEAQTKAMEEAATPIAGETTLVGLFKQVTTMEELQILSKGRKHPDPHVREMQEENLKALTFPITAAQIMETIAARGDKTELKAAINAKSSIASALTSFAELMKKSATVDVPPPPGFTEDK